MNAPDEDVRLYYDCVRSSVFVSKYGNLYRFYKDTQIWEVIFPRIDEHGCIRALQNKNLTQIIAEAWHGRPCQLKCPTVLVTNNNPHNSDNLHWPKNTIVQSNRINKNNN